MKGGLPYTAGEPLPDGTRVTPARLIADDGMESSGWLYEPATPSRVVVTFAHPRAEFGRHYAIPGLVRAGLAVFGQNSRYLNNDAEGIRERVLLDVAAGQRWLRARDFRHVILCGNSGGGVLSMGYQAEATRPPAERASTTPGGGKIDLTGEMPKADGLIIVAAHAGEGRFLLRTIDPSVTDEQDPLSCDATLDMFNPANGYDLATRTARYSAEFLARYREAQHARVKRLDELALARIAAERQARTSIKDSAGYELLLTSRRAIPHDLMKIHRTVANPAYLDRSIEPNDRDLGSIFGLVMNRPEFGNFFELNVARILSPRAWLSTWSGISSRGDFLTAAATVREPVLFMPATGDSDILPAEADEMWRAITAEDKVRHDLAGADHYLRPTTSHPAATPRRELIATMAAWIEARFGR